MAFPNRRDAALLALAAAGVALGGAWFAETQLGLVPCALCLLERWPFRVLAVLAALAAAWPGGRRAMLALASATMLAGVALGAVHTGVEQRWWPSPLPGCTAPARGVGTMEERLARLPARPAKPCDEPIWIIDGLPVSFANLQLGLALALTAMLATSAVRTERML